MPWTGLTIFAVALNGLVPLVLVPFSRTVWAAIWLLLHRMDAPPPARARATSSRRAPSTDPSLPASSSWNAPLAPPRALEQVGGLPTQYAPSGYIGLWGRLEGFRRETLTKALEQRRVVQATLMRVTIHTVSAEDFRLFVAGTRMARRAWWLRVHGARPQRSDMEAAATPRPRTRWGRSSSTAQSRARGNEKGHIAVQPFHRLPKAARRELDGEAERLASFHQG